MITKHGCCGENDVNLISLFKTRCCLAAISEILDLVSLNPPTDISFQNRAHSQLDFHVMKCNSNGNKKFNVMNPNGSLNGWK